MKDFKPAQKVRLKRNVGQLIKNEISDYNEKPHHYDKLIHSFTSNIGRVLVIDNLIDGKDEWYGNIPFKGQKFYRIKTYYSAWGNIIPECFIDNFSEKINNLLKL